MRLRWGPDAVTMAAEGTAEYHGEFALPAAPLGGAAYDDVAAPPHQTVNANALRDALAALPGEVVTARFAGPDIPLLLSGSDEHGAACATIMPMFDSVAQRARGAERDEA